MFSVDVTANDNNLCGESPIWDWEKEQLYWINSVGLKFYGNDRQKRQRVLPAGDSNLAVVL